jgi:hypothetical protein
VPSHGLGRVAHPDTPAASALYPVTRRADYRATLATYKYWWQGGAWLDQGQTGTCVGYTFAHRRADSPVPVAGITGTWARNLYVDASGDETLQEGTSGLAACRVLAGRGTITAYHWVTSAQELRNTVLAMGTVCVGTDWYGSMFEPYAKYSNMYLRVDSSSGLAGGHEYLINGINLQPTYGKPYYRVKNSWGTGWGKGGTARILCADLEDLVFNHAGDAVIVTEAL